MTPPALERWTHLLFAQPLYLLAGASLVAVLILRLLWMLVRQLRHDPYPYVAAPALLTPAERAFHGALRQALGGEYVLFAKVRLADILQLDRAATGKHRWQAFTRISSKHADFVVCDPRSFRVLGVIELDDRSHQQSHRRQRDEFFDAAFAAASIPVWRVPVQRSYPPGPLREQILAFLNTARPAA